MDSHPVIDPKRMAKDQWGWLVAQPATRHALVFHQRPPPQRTQQQIGLGRTHRRHPPGSNAVIRIERYLPGKDRFGQRARVLPFQSTGHFVAVRHHPAHTQIGQHSRPQGYRVHIQNVRPQMAQMLQYR